MVVEKQQTNLMKYSENLSDRPVINDLNEYTLSYFMKIPDTYERPKPHPVWWRRGLGQTVSSEAGFKRYTMTYKIPKDQVYKLWVQRLLTTSLHPAMYHTLEVKEKTTTSYIKTHRP